MESRNNTILGRLGLAFCSFRVCEPTIWYTLPQDLQSADTRERFKCKLRNWLFECAHGRRYI